MNLIVKGHQLEWENNDNYKIVEADVSVAASRRAGVWLVDDDDAERNGPLFMVLGAATENDAARAYALQRKAHGCVPSTVFRVFALASARDPSRCRES